MVKNFNKKGICPIRKSKNWIYGVIRPYTFSFFYYISYILYIPHLSSYIFQEPIFFPQDHDFQTCEKRAKTGRNRADGILRTFPTDSDFSFAKSLCPVFSMISYVFFFKQMCYTKNFQVLWVTMGGQWILEPSKVASQQSMAGCWNTSKREIKSQWSL